MVFSARAAAIEASTMARPSNSVAGFGFCWYICSRLVGFISHGNMGASFDEWSDAALATIAIVRSLVALTLSRNLFVCAKPHAARNGGNDDNDKFSLPTGAGFL